MNIALQYLVETFAVLVVTLPLAKRRDPRRTLVVLSGLDVLRFGGVAGALGAMHGSRSPHFLALVAIGDGLTATLALVLLVALARRAESARAWVVAMNLVGLAGIFASEAGLTVLGVHGFHTPTVGASIFTALHVVALRLAQPQGSAMRDAGIHA